jgi:hypothetical protein
MVSISKLLFLIQKLKENLINIDGISKKTIPEQISLPIVVKVNGYNIKIGENCEVGIFEYTPLEYIQATGTQYIDTGYKPNNDTTVICKFYYENALDETLYGVWTGGSKGTNFSANINKSGNWRFGNETIVGGNILNNEKYINTIVTSTMGQEGLLYNSEKVGSYNLNDFQSNYTMYIFSVNENGQAKYLCKNKIYSFQILENNKLVRDFVPALDEKDVACLYERVEDEFYYNQGTQAFIFKK